jgi:hypothetical protein
VQADDVVVLDVAGDDAQSVFEGQGELGADAVASTGAVEAFELAVALDSLGDVGFVEWTDTVGPDLG